MQLDPARSYDLIGDVHGCARTLQQLLEQLGYRYQAGTWRHPWRMALFLGDIIDRGPRIRQALDIVYSMVDAGQAACLMGNHEFYALGWATPALPGSGRHYVREHTARHERLFAATLQQFVGHEGDWRDYLAWFQQLPLLFDGERFRAVHACWDGQLIAQLRQRYPESIIDRAFIQQTLEPQSLAHQVTQRLLRGTDLPLPAGMSVLSDEGFVRRSFRTKFWADEPKTYGDIVFQPDGLPENAAQQRLTQQEKQKLLYYGPEQPLLFVGHYWRRGRPAPIRDNLACLDYSAVKFGKLVAYRLDQEQRLDPDKFCWVKVQPAEDVL